MSSTQTIPERSEVPDEHKWNLHKLFESDQAWEKGLQELTELIPRLQDYKGTLEHSAAHLAEAMQFLDEVSMLAERLGYYANLRYAEDAGDPRNQERYARAIRALSEASTAASWVEPELQGIPDDTIEAFLKDERLAQYQVKLRKILRMKPHVLSEQEEKLLAMQAEANQTPQKAFHALIDVDLEFGNVDTAEGPRPLTQSTLHSFLLDPDRRIREQAYRQFYRGFDAHKNTIAALYSGSVDLDIYKARVRSFPSARAAALFPDNIPESVYDNLVETVGAYLPTLHRYYRLRKEALELDEYHLFDNYVPLVPEVEVRHAYEQAVEVVSEALAPLGAEYTRTLRDGLLGDWVDRYENKGKRSGAFSAGSYHGDPYILMNFKEDVLRDVFTLAHEGGHSMHSYYSARNNPFAHYDYTIFEAEVASTLNEQLLLKYLLDRAETERMRAYLINKSIDDFVGTLFRQTMFAEFEHLAHRTVEEGSPLTLGHIRELYRGLLQKFFGPDATLDPESDLEALRIPHFYRAFYVFKYATGLSAAVTLSRRVMEGGDAEREAYFDFLKSGGARFPLDSLRLAGVDMAQPDPIEQALNVFASRLGELEELLPRVR